MTWRDAARLSDVAFTELSLQAIYAFRQGNVVPPDPAHRLVPRARRRVLESKGIVAFVLGILTFLAAYALRESSLATAVFRVPVPTGVFEAGVLTGLFSLDVAFLWWTGMQVLPTFLASGVMPVLEPLPIDDRTMRRAAALLYLRLFDLPALTVLFATPVLVGFSLGLWAGVAVLPGAAAAVGFALALSLVTGRFFVRRVQGSRGGGGATVVRWTYLVLWLVPAFAMFGLVTAAPDFFAFLGAVSIEGPSPTAHVLLAVFPFTLAVLPALAASGPAGLGLDPAGWLFLGVASAAYCLLAVWAIVWVLASVRQVSMVPPADPRAIPTPRIDVRTQPVLLAVLTKDLRIASRTPGYAFLILLPMLDALAIGLWTFVSAPDSSVAFGLALAAVTTAALLATFFGPAFFAIEVLAFSYGRTLPLSDRSLLAGKVLLVALMYLVASGIVLGITLVRVFDPAIFALFIVAELPAVVAASLLELGILFRRSRARGLPITNLYAGAWYAVLVSIPGVIVAGAPLVAFQAARIDGTPIGVLAMAAVAVAELAFAVPFALGREVS